MGFGERLCSYVGTGFWLVLGVDLCEGCYEICYENFITNYVDFGVIFG